MTTAIFTTTWPRVIRVVWLYVVMGVGCTNTLKNVDFGENARTVEPVSARAAIISLAYSDDGKTIAALHEFVHPHDTRCSPGGAPRSWLRVWNVDDESHDWYSNNGLDLGSAALGSRAFGAIRLSRDGKEIYVAHEGKDGGKLAVWNTDNNQLEHRHLGWVRAVGPHADVIVTHDDETGLSICDQHGQPIDHAWQSEEIRKGFPPGWRDSFSADGRLIGILVEKSDWPKTVFIVDWQTGKAQSSFTAEKSFWNFAISPNGRLIAMTGFDGPDIEVRDAQNGKLITTLKMEADDFWDVAFSPDGELLAVSGCTEPEKKKNRQGQTAVWHISTWQKLKTFIDRDSWATTAVTFSRDSKTLACGTTNGTIRFHQVESQD